MQDPNVPSRRMRIGRLLKLYRAHEDTSIREAARAMGLSAATLSRIEAGRDVDAETLVKLILWMRGTEE
jgi:transcriptional regulator with XRE-family HTH domain